MDENLDQELILSQQQEFDDRKELLKNAMGILDQKVDILKARRLDENPKTLEELSAKFRLVERVRQIETKARKVTKIDDQCKQIKKLASQKLI